LASQAGHHDNGSRSPEFHNAGALAFGATGVFTLTLGGQLFGRQHLSPQLVNNGGLP